MMLKFDQLEEEEKQRIREAFIFMKDV